MDTTIRANIRQFAALWYSAELHAHASQELARERALMQVGLYLSDFGMGEKGAAEYLKAADQAIDQMFQHDVKSN